MLYGDLQLRGGCVIHQISTLDPMGRFFVRCDKHKDCWQEIFVSNNLLESDMWLMLKRTAQRIIDACPKCINENPVENPRWPEGAEL
jgi:hypothetical protein